MFIFYGRMISNNSNNKFNNIYNNNVIAERRNSARNCGARCNIERRTQIGIKGYILTLLIEW